MAKVWIMSPNNKNIKVVKYDFVLSCMFPNGFECKQYLNPDIFEYYVVFYDADEGGVYNPSAKWISKDIGVVPTGNFIIMKKKWYDNDDKEYTIDMDITPAEFKKKFMN